MTDATITCNLLRNALEHFVTAGEDAKGGSDRRLRQALATIYEGVELLLKARLEMDGWELLLRDVTKADRAKYERGDIQSITFDEAVKRLEGICSVTISGTHRRTLDELRQLRNRIRHHTVKTDRPTAFSLIAKAYLFALDFMNESLAYSDTEDDDGEIEMLVADLRSLLGEFDEFVALRMEEIGPEMGRVEAAFVACPFCLQATLFGDCGVTRCRFCGYEDFADAAVDTWMSNVWLFPTPDYREAWMKHSWGICPACDEATCVCAAGHEGGVNYVCLSCGRGGELVECGTCGGLVNDEGRCGRCSEGRPCGCLPAIVAPATAGGT